MSVAKCIHGDCLEKMKDIADKSIDMILCDLPYGTTACKWDVVIPFEPLWEQYKRIIKDRGAIVLFGSEPFSSYLRMSNISFYRYDWIWEKSRAGNCFFRKAQPMKFHENISVFSKLTAHNMSKKAMAYYPQMEIRDKTNARRNKPRQSIISDVYGGERFLGSKTENGFSEFIYPKTIIKIHSRGGGFHPTEKPTTILEYLIKTYTLEGETVLDNCMGSGSTGVACVNTGRNFIGIEKDDKYFGIAEKRISDAIKDKAGNLF